MNDKASGAMGIEGGLILIFVLLGVMLTGIITANWLLVIEPLLREDAASRSLALAQAEGRALERLFGGHCDQADLRAELETALSNMLLLREPATEKPFIRHVQLVMDYEQLGLPPGSLDIAAGSLVCADCFEAEIPLYHPESQQLIGVATVVTSPEFLRTLMDTVRTRLLWIGVASLGLIGLAALGSRQLLRRLRHMEEELRQAALTDVLTGIANRRALFDRLTDEVERLRRYPDQPLSIILLDLDEFKAINDRFGHATGDEVLVRVARTVLGVVRKTDVVGRYGGEEFLVILPNVGIVGARDVAERVRRAVEQLTWTQPGLRLTVSGGVSEASGEEPDRLIDAADRKLYEAKDAGRNRMVG